MVRASGQIEQSLAQLQTATGLMKDECEELYQNYFEALSKAGQRQLALATYHLCTHVYPEQFLALKFSQREKLQRAVRRLGSQIYEQLMAEWSKAKVMSRREEPEDPMATIKQLFLQAESKDSPDDDSDEASKLEAEVALRALDSETFDDAAFEDIAFDDDVLDKDALDDGILHDGVLHELTRRSQAVEALASELLLDEVSTNTPATDTPATDTSSTEADSKDEPLADLANDLASEPLQATTSDSASAALSLPTNTSTHPNQDQDDTLEDDTPLDAVQLLKQQIFVEKAIRNVLRAVSETANYMLQQAKIVPEMPKPLLAAVTESDGVAQSPLKMPHLLKVSVKILNVDERPREKGRGKKRRKPRLVELEAFPEFVIIHLRLSEIEFSEPSVSIWRSRIREQLGKLKKLGRTYQKNQRELAIAQAEDAWRASWIED